MVVKAQVQVGGRGKAGGIKLAANADEARRHAGDILGMDIKGHIVEGGLDREGQRHRRGVLRVLHARPRRQAAPRDALRAGRGRDRAGGRGEPRAIAKIHIDPVDGLTEAECREWVAAAAARPGGSRGCGRHLLKLYRAYVDGDADLVEINPLILTPDGRVHALDAKVTLDDNAVFRHPDYDEYDATQVRTRVRQFAARAGPAVRRARRVGRRHRQRRRAGHEHRRHRQPGRR